MLSIAGLDIRPNNSKKGHKHSNSGSRKKNPHQSQPLRAIDGLPNSSSTPGAIDLSESVDGPATIEGKDDSTRSIFMTHPSGRIAKARAKRGSVMDAFPAAKKAKAENDADPFLVVPSSKSSTIDKLATSTNSDALDSSLIILPPSNSSSNSNRPPKSPRKSRLRIKADRERTSNKNKERRKENKHSRLVLQERFEDASADPAPMGSGSGSDGEDVLGTTMGMVIDMEDLTLGPAPSNTPALTPTGISSSSDSQSASPTTPAPFLTAAPSSTEPTAVVELAPSAPIAIPPSKSPASIPLPASVSPPIPTAPVSASPKSQKARPQSQSFRPRVQTSFNNNSGVNSNSTPSTPPRNSVRASKSTRILGGIQFGGQGQGFLPASTNQQGKAPPNHTRTQSHPTIPLSWDGRFGTASAPSSPSAPHLASMGMGVSLTPISGPGTFGGYNFSNRYANSTFQHSPSPSVLPKPKFLEMDIEMEMEERMEIDEVLV